MTQLYHISHSRTTGSEKKYHRRKEIGDSPLPAAVLPVWY